MRAQGAGGWQFFVATLLIVIGAVNIVQGLVAFFTPVFYAATGADVLLLEYTSWGVLLGLWGVVLVVAGLAVLSHSTWARAFALVLAAANAIAQLGFVMAMPLWSMVAIAVDILVIYGLTAGWPSREPADTERPREGEAAYRSGYEASHATPHPTRSPEQTSGSHQTTESQ
ncbi:hypothetical protein A6A08_08965 [Nocardiopsis sp. TSRI0078]|uniref:DUF7144 family membrane protein n=1 Tax=unclassified Nocardiopsis TaxID=2649073 RepID=UPI0009399791|nr:hypothetical protein [Nocardiopsis sp. TSRI0078]OKI15691.1 hypothetical protein A6A08_08965 [Nocardiopsis sp. TSRI0078]